MDRDKAVTTSEEENKVFADWKITESWSKKIPTHSQIWENRAQRSKDRKESLLPREIEIHMQLQKLHQQTKI